MEQSQSFNGEKTLQQLKDRLHNLRQDANEVITAATHDYEQIKVMVKNLRAKSELRAYVLSHLNGPATITTVKSALPARKKATRAKTAKSS